MDFRATWSQIALEHVDEKLRAIEKKIRREISEDKALVPFRQCEDRLPPLALYRLLEERAGVWVGQAYQAYCSTWEQQGRQKSRDFCIAVFQLGILPFLRNKVLNLLCFALATAQPALKINTSVEYSLNSSDLQRGARLAGVRRILDSLQNQWSWKVMSVDAGESPASGISAPQFAPISLADPKLQESMVEAKSIWDRIAHERVKERLTIVFFHVSGLFPTSRGDAYRAYSEQASRAKHSSSKVVSRELEEALFKLEDVSIQRAFEIYEEETPEKKIKTASVLYVIYSLGLVPFIEGRVLVDICSKLDDAQPSLELNILREDGERFFSYNSQKLRNGFPVVIRIVDSLKIHWRDKITDRARTFTTHPPVAGSAEIGSIETYQSPEVQVDSTEENEQVGRSAEVPSAASEPISSAERAPLPKAQEAPETAVFSHSESYEAITFNGENYTLQKRQAEVVRLLHEALKKGHPEVPTPKLLRLPGCEDVGSVRDIFKSRPQLWGTLIVNCEVIGSGRGFYRLNPSIKT